MSCTERDRPPVGAWVWARAGRGLGLLAVALGLSGCGTPAPPPSGAPVGPAVVPLPRAGSADVPAVPTQPAPGQPGATRPLVLPPPVAARNWDDFRRQAALRMVAANPDITYITTPPDPLLAIPVLEIELHADGSIRDIQVLRHPRQAKDTTRIAIDAVRRAAPFGDMRHLKRPWKFAEVFLFDDDGRFKPRTLDD